MDELDAIRPATVDAPATDVARRADEQTALRSFDAYFLGEMLKRSAPENPSGLFDGGQAGRMYQDHLYEEMARIIAESGRFGISKALEGTLETPAESPRGAADSEEQDS